MDLSGWALSNVGTRGSNEPGRPGSAGPPVSAAVKLGGFLLLLVAIFSGAYGMGAHLGPVSTTQSPSGGGSSMNMGGSGSMNVGGQPAQQARLRGGRP